MLKKIFSAILVVILFTGMSSVVFANENRDMSSQGFEIEYRYAEAFLESIGHPSSVKEPILLKNFNNEYEALCFSIVDGGYIIININDLSIPELSLESDMPYVRDKNAQYIYNGPLQYFELDSDIIRAIKSGTIVERELIDNVYSKDKIDTAKRLEFFLENSPEHVNTEKYLKGTLRLWTMSGGLCGPIAGSISMMYYDDYIDNSYVDTYYESSSRLIPLMNTYMDTDKSGGTTATEVRKGLNSYMSDRGVSNTAYSSSFNFNTVKSKINVNRPTIVGTKGHPNFKNHWIISHGYFESLIDGEFIIVNDGWGRNGVWVTTDTSHLDYVIYFSR